MASERSGSRRYLALQALFSEPSMRALLAAAPPPLPEEDAAWLGQLCLLQGVPFDVLVPDARMLPPESIRFFFVDQNALDSLVDGALSVVALTSEEGNRRRPAPQHPARPRPAQCQLWTTSPSRPFGPCIRARSRRCAARRGDANPPVWTGFLLRSAAVAGWPGLTVTGFASGKPLALLRLDRPSPSVMIAIFSGVVEKVELSQPAQSLSFGMVAEAANQPPRVYLRFIGGGEPAGKQPPGDPDVSVTLRDEGRGVIDVTRLVSDIKVGLTAAYGMLPVPPFGAGALGIQMVRPTERQPFVHLVHRPVLPVQAMRRTPVAPDPRAEETPARPAGRQASDDRSGSAGQVMAAPALLVPVVLEALVVCQKSTDHAVLGVDATRVRMALAVPHPRSHSVQEAAPPRTRRPRWVHGRRAALGASGRDHPGHRRANGGNRVPWGADRWLVVRKHRDPRDPRTWAFASWVLASDYVGSEQGSPFRTHQVMGDPDRTALAARPVAWRRRDS